MQKLKDYQGFGVDLRELAKVLILTGRSSVKNAELLEETGYGTNKVRAVKEYLADFDLLAAKNVLTPLGDLILAYDARFKETFTKWLALYHWSFRENNPFLNFLVNDYTNVIDDSGMLRKFMSWAGRNDIKTDYDSDKVSGLVNKTRAALLEDHAFQSLNLFISYDGQLHRSEPYNVHPYLVAYILFYNQKGRTTISFSELLDEKNNIARFFNWNSKELETKMVELMNHKLVNMVHHANLHLVTYVYKDSPESLIKRYYEEC